MGGEKKSAITGFRTTTESNTIFHSLDESIPNNDSIRVEPLPALSGTYSDVPMNFVKDDGCHTNRVSR